ncbi:MAG: DUF3047 domain-containing protein [Deltaproteobacteria bacterium]|nr:DUF3047 domain-containing protein [Deltaproteobacteria bacterium]
MLLCFCALFAFPLLLSASSPILVDDYSQGLSRWKEKSFKGNTLYQVVQTDRGPAIQARSRGAASGLYREMEFDPAQHPVLSWSWKISGVLEKGDARTKQGDDYAARVYVVFPSVLFWRTKALNYIWANKLEKGAVVKNAYTSNAMMIAVQSGNENAGRWVQEKRNLVEDYRRAFGEDPPGAGAVAVMTDTDDTGESATAWYGRILLLPRGS